MMMKCLEISMGIPTPHADLFNRCMYEQRQHDIMHYLQGKESTECQAEEEGCYNAIYSFACLKAERISMHEKKSLVGCCKEKRPYYYCVYKITMDLIEEVGEIFERIVYHVK